jgi:hypothetical protein
MDCMAVVAVILVDKSTLWRLLSSAVPTPKVRRRVVQEICVVGVVAVCLVAVLEYQHNMS